MYNSRPNLLIGFHGCDKDVRDKLVNSPNKVNKSQEKFDWLGNGFYVWENNYGRALQWAKDKHKRGKISIPSVVGVLYTLDYCLDLTDSRFINELPNFYELLKADLKLVGKSIPENKNTPKDKYNDLLIRELDCAVIEFMHKEIENEIKENKAQLGYSDLKCFDTARGIFTEGGPIFEGAGIQAKTHIQVCIRNLNCIKGFFIPRRLTTFP